MCSETLNAVARRYLADVRAVSPRAAAVVEQVFPNAVEVLASAIDRLEVTSIASPEAEYLYVMPDGTTYRATSEVALSRPSGALESLAAFKAAP